jgi:hypothetical protein
MCADRSWTSLLKKDMVQPFQCPGEVLTDRPSEKSRNGTETPGFRETGMPCGIFRIKPLIFPFICSYDTV